MREVSAVIAVAGEQLRSCVSILFAVSHFFSLVIERAMRDGVARAPPVCFFLTNYYY